MKRLLFILMLAAALPVYGQFPEGAVEAAGITDTMAMRAEAYRTAMRSAGNYRYGVYIYTRRSIDDYGREPVKLAARLAVLGFTDVYLGCEAALGDGDLTRLRWQKAFIEAAHKWGMAVWALRLSSGRLYVGNEKLYEDCKSVIDYNYSVKKSQRFDGVSADLEPHIFKAGFIDRPKELKLAWSNNYFPGGDNDLLLERTVEVMKIAKKELEPLKLSQAMGFFFQPRVDSGLLTHGGASEFLQYCDYLVVMAYNYRKERIWEMAKPLIVDAGEKPASISVCVKTSLGTHGDEGPVTSLQPHGWGNLLPTMRYLVEQGSAHKSFRGVDVFEFQGFEIIWEERVPQSKTK